MGVGSICHSFSCRYRPYSQSMFTRRSMAGMSARFKNKITPQGEKIPLSLIMLAPLLFLCLSAVSASSCDTIYQHHETNCNIGDKCGHLLTFETSSVQACCAACNATCSAWTLLEGVCRTKSGDWTLTKSKAKGTSGIRTPDNTTTTAPLPTPPPVPTPPGVKNILFIAVDDLRPEVGAFGHKHGINGKSHTPNIDKLGLFLCYAFSLVLKITFTEK